MYREWYNAPVDLREPKQAGEFRNLTRFVKSDGMRVMSALSEFLGPGQDPVAFLAGLLSEAGFDAHNFGEYFEDPEVSSEESST